MIETAVTTTTGTIAKTTPTGVISWFVTDPIVVTTARTPGDNGIIGSGATLIRTTINRDGPKRWTILGANSLKMVFLLTDVRFALASYGGDRLPPTAHPSIDIPNPSCPVGAPGLGLTPRSIPLSPNLRVRP